MRTAYFVQALPVLLAIKETHSLLISVYMYLVFAGPAGQDMGPTASAQPAGASQVTKRKPAAAQHPLAELGGYKMPTAGRIGGAKGIGSSAGGVVKRKGQPGGVTAGKSSKPVSKEEADAIAAREAAKKRVQQRTLSTFGLG